MTFALSEMQKTWLRGLAVEERMLPMSASELGNPEVSTLQSLGLVRIFGTLEGRHWDITDAGKKALAESQ